ncbi:MAG: D-alanyl-D-alanine carboxypeptidase, partial [Pseudomonadota bacterium]|nr:D-alanyl-D-alanine carboxypeptidase [Pseudomonadota bacterium]
MTGRRRRTGHYGLFVFTAFWFLVVLPLSVMAAPYAGMVMDARTGKVYYSENADTRLHPASLTKMMTLYIAFEAVENG